MSSKINRKVIYLIAFLYFSFQAKAQTEESGLLTFTRLEAIDFALTHNLNLVAAYTTVEQAIARHSDAGTLKNPALNLGMATDYGLTDEGQYTYTVGFEQQFPITNRLKLLKDIATIEVRLAIAEIRDQKRLLILDLDKRIVELAALNEQIEIRQKLIHLNERLITFLSSKTETGEASLMDVNQLRVKLHATEQEIRKLSMRREELLGSIRMLMGIPIYEAFAIQANLVLPKQIPALDEVTQDLLEMHPEYQLKQMLTQIADKHTNLAIANRWADVAVQLFFQQNRSYDEPVGLINDRFVGVGFSIPLPIHNKSHGKIEASHAYLRQTKHELDASGFVIRSQANIYANRVFQLHEQATDFNRDVVRLAEQNMADVQAVYETGQIDLTALFLAQEQALTIQFLQLELLHDYELALVEWQAATADNLKYFTHREREGQ